MAETSPAVNLLLPELLYPEYFRGMSKTCVLCGGTGKIITGSEAKSIREKKNLTLRQVSEAMGCALTYLSDLENGRKAWSHDWETRFRKACK
jgi:hypothetical protein